MTRALGCYGGAEPDIIDAITWASGGVVARASPSINPTPTKVVNMSLGGTGSCNVPMQTAITSARNRGAMIMVVTGNGSTLAIDSSANCTGTIVVMAHTLEGDKATCAGVGTGTTLSAPGSSNGSVVNGLGVLIALFSNAGTTSAGLPGYSGEAGTSMATLHMTGVVILMLSANSALIPD